MANMYINAMTALWNNVGTLYSAIKMNVTDSGSSDIPASKLIDLQVGAVTKFNADKNGNVYAAGDITALGDLTVGGVILPSTGDTVALGSNNNPWSDLWLGEEAGIRWGPIGSASDVVIQHATNKLTLQGGDLLIEEPGTDTKSAVTASATQTLRNKTMDGGIIKDVTEFSTLASAHRIGLDTPTSATVVRRHNGGSVVLAGGMDTTGAYLELYGATHASAPKGWTLSSGDGGKYRFDSALNTHYFTNNAGTNILTIGADGISASKVVSENGQFSSNTHVYIGAVASGGYIHFRPYGATNGTNQAYIDTSGNFVAPGAVHSGQDFQSTSTHVVLAANSGNVYFRPYGAGNATYEAYQSTSGGMASGFFHTTGTGASTISFYNGTGPVGANHGLHILGSGAANSAAGFFQTYSGASGAANAHVYLGFHQVNVNWWGIYVNGPAISTVGWSVSDAKFKSQITNCDCHESYDKVRAIKVKSYHKEGVNLSRKGPNERGFLAQDIEALIPEAVMDVPIARNNPDDGSPLEPTESMKVTNDRTLLATLWAAVQHQAELIEALQAKIEGK